MRRKIHQFLSEKKKQNCLHFQDIFNIKNKLFINTSYEACSQIRSDFVWDIMLGDYHIIGLDIDVLTYFRPKKVKINYFRRFRVRSK